MDSSAPSAVDTAKPAPDRGALLVAMAEACAATGGPKSAKASAALSDLFLTLARPAETADRVRLAERLAGAAWAPSALVAGLAGMEAEVARPLIAHSPALGTEQLLRLVERSPEHAVEVARRHAPPPAVQRALAVRADPLACAALAANPAAELTPDVMDRLVEHARNFAALRASLARRPELEAQHAERLSGWVSEGLRAQLASRFDLKPRLADSFAEQDEIEARLVAKLEDAGQLKPGYLLRTLREGKLSLFAAALSSLGDFKREEVRKTLDSDRPDLLALAARAVSIDRSVWPTLLSLVRGLNDGRPGEGAPGAVTEALAENDPVEAALKFRRGVQAS